MQCRCAGKTWSISKNWADYALLNNGNKLTLLIFINYFVLNEQRVLLNTDSIVCGLMRIWSLLLTTIKYNLIWLYLKLSKCHYHVFQWKASIKANPSNQYLKWQLINLFEQISATASTWNLSQKCWMWWNLKSFNLLTNLSFVFIMLMFYKLTFFI